MFKTALAATAALVAAAPASIASPYLNIESNIGYSGTVYPGAIHEAHVGWEGSNEQASYYIQGGPAYLSPNSLDGEFEFSAKAGGAVAVSRKVSVYGELSMITGDKNGYGAKTGLKYSF